MPLLSVIVPVYNEVKTVKEILQKIASLDIDKEIIVVDDGSNDGSDKLLNEIDDKTVKVIHHTTNRGKGAAFLTGLHNATGEYVIIQDADLEYDPNDYYKMLEAIKHDGVDFVLGARFKHGYRGLFFHRLGNRSLTWLINLFFKAQLNDYATCYKLARRDIFNSLNFKGVGFDLEVEIICKILKRRLKIAEVPVLYTPRTYKAGKKIRVKDGLWSIFYLFKYRFSR